jgi:hypothetical protein
MPTPFRYDKTLKLYGGTRGQSIQQMMLDKFYQVQGGRSGSYADRERGFLVAQGAPARDSRYDMWKRYLSSARPFTDGVPAASFPTLADRAYMYPVIPASVNLSVDGTGLMPHRLRLPGVATVSVSNGQADRVRVVKRDGGIESSVSGGGTYAKA